MKHSILSLITLLFSSSLFAQQSTVVNGTIKGENAVEAIYLRYIYDGAVKDDSTQLKDGKFSFAPNINEPAMVAIRIKHPATEEDGKPTFETRQLYVAPGSTTLTIIDSLKNAVISGGKATLDYEDLQSQLKPYNEKARALSQEYKKYRQDNDEEGMHRLEAAFDALDSTQNEDVYLAFLKANPESPLALYVLETYAGYDIDANKIDPLFSELNESIKNSKGGKNFAERLAIARKTSVGTVAMDFTQNDTLDKPVSLSDFCGKYVLVDFWASWCGPCRMENPNVVKAFSQYKDKNFTVLGVSLDQEGQKTAWIEAIHKDELTWTHVSDLKFWENAVAVKYGIRAIPQNFLIGPDGVIIAKNVRGDKLWEKLAEVLD